MRKILGLLLLSVLVLLNCGKTDKAVGEEDTATGTGVVFRELAFDEALALAEKEGKPVMIDLFLPG